MANCRFDCPYAFGTGKRKLSGTVVCRYTEQIKPSFEKEEFCGGKYIFDNSQGAAICPTLKKPIVLPKLSVVDPSETERRKKIIASVTQGKPPTPDYVLALCTPEGMSLEEVSFAFKHQLYGLYLSGAIEPRKVV